MTVLLHPQQLLKYTPEQQFNSPPKTLSVLLFWHYNHKEKLLEFYSLVYILKKSAS